MKLSLAPLAALLFGLSLPACSSEDAVAPAAAPSAVPPNDAGAPVTPKRTFVDRSILATAPDNLLLDPEMTLNDDEVGLSGFLLLSGQTVVRPAIRSLTTPLGGVRRAALIVGSAATETKSPELVMLTSFTGVVGPLEVSVWLSRTTSKGDPSDAAMDASVLLSKDMTLGGPGSTGVELVPDEESRVTVDGRVWIKHVARVNDDSFERGGQFSIATGVKGGGLLVLAPEARAVKAADRHRAPPSRGERRALRNVEREAITRLRALPVRFARPMPPAPEGRALLPR